MVLIMCGFVYLSAVPLVARRGYWVPGASLWVLELERSTSYLLSLSLSLERVGSGLEVHQSDMEEPPSSDP